MAKPSRIQRNGNGFLILMDDGARYRALRDGAGQYLVSQGEAAPPDPDPDPPDPEPGAWAHPLGRAWPFTSYSEVALGLPPGSHDAGALDFPCGVESPPLFAAHAGPVIFAGWEDGGGGNCVITAGPNGEGITYAHLSSIGVSVGQTVTAGQQVGLVGMTGAATGNHLHLEVRINGTNWGPWHRSYEYFQSKGIDLGNRVG